MRSVPTSPALSRSLSIYIDLVRGLAAVAVFFCHLASRDVSGGFLWQIFWIGHVAVMVFFVLSGFVIAHAATTKDRTASDYAVSRLVRLFSVIVPALLLTLLLDTVGTHIDPGLYAAVGAGGSVAKYLAALSFTNQIWFFDVAPSSNIPYWSMPFEFWYYAIFGAVFYFRGRTRLVLAAVGVLIAGPKILLYMPLWLLGVATYHFLRLRRPSPRLGIFLLIGSVALFADAVMLRDLGYLPIIFLKPFVPDTYSAADYLIGLAVAMNILGAGACNFRFGGAARPIRFVAGYTFSLYLYHMPLLLFFRAVMPAGYPVPLRAALLAIPTLAAVFALGAFTERRKEMWRGVVSTLVPPPRTALPAA